MGNWEWGIGNGELGIGNRIYAKTLSFLLFLPVLCVLEWFVFSSWCVCVREWGIGENAITPYPD
jgi:hypothetical protein